MTPENVRKRVLRIIDTRDKPGQAQFMENDLWKDVLTSISIPSSLEARELASEALKTLGVEFERVYP